MTLLISKNVWVSGADLMRFGKIEDEYELVQLLTGLPIYRLSEKNDYESINHLLNEYKNAVGSTKSRTQPVALLPWEFNQEIPSFKLWQFNGLELSFWFKLNNSIPDNTEWLSPNDIMNRWSISACRLASYVIDDGLPAHRLTIERGIVAVTKDAFAQSCGLRNRTCCGLVDCLFHLVHVLHFEMNHKPRVTKKSRLDWVHQEDFAARIMHVGTHIKDIMSFLKTCDFAKHHKERNVRAHLKKQLPSINRKPGKPRENG